MQPIKTLPLAHAELQVSDPNHLAIERPSRRTTARRVLLTAVVCGFVGDVLLRTAVSGINLVLYMTLAIVTTGMIIQSHTGTLPRNAKRFLILALIFSALVMLRGESFLTFLNVVNAAIALSLAVAAAVAAASPTAMFQLRRVRDVVKSIVFSAKYVLFGTFFFIGHDASAALEVTSAKLYATRILLRGAVLAVALTGIFAMMLSAGDPVFAKAFALPAEWQFDKLLGHVLLTGFLAWPVLGLQWSATIGDTTPTSDQLTVLDTDWRVLNRVDVLAILGSLNGLFAAFLLVQLRVLFGGAEYVLGMTGLSIAQYARNGFFTLVATAALVLVSLLTIDATFKDGAISAWKVSRRLSVTLLGGVALVLVSAATRMTLYVSAFGASTERFYCYAIMAWLSFVLLFFGRTVLRNRPTTFAMGSLAAAWLTLITVNVVNVEALVTRINVDRAAHGAPLDLKYTIGLGSEAVPALVQGIAAMPLENIAAMDFQGAGSACAAIGALHRDWTSTESRQNVGWSLSQWRAKKAVARYDRALRLRSCDAVPATSVPAPAAPVPTAPAPSPSL